MLVHDHVGHRYWWDGKRVPGVTDVLASAGMSEGFEFLSPEALRFAGDRGRAVHAATALDDLRELDEASVDPIAAPYLAAWRRFRAESGFTPTAIEQYVYHPTYRYAGTLDREGTLGHTDVLLDIKTGAPQRSTGPQTAAYLAARGGKRNRWAVFLQPDGRYNLVPHNDRSDLAAFLAALTIYNWKGNGNA